MKKLELIVVFCILATNGLVSGEFSDDFEVLPNPEECLALLTAPRVPPRIIQCCRTLLCAERIRKVCKGTNEKCCTSTESQVNTTANHDFSFDMENCPFLLGSRMERNENSPENLSATSFQSLEANKSDQSTFQINHDQTTYKNNAKSSTIRDAISLQFLDIPKGDDLRIRDRKTDEEYLLFEVFAELMAYLLPSGFPSDLLRNAVHKHIPIQEMAFQILKLDLVVVIWIVFWGLVSICLPLVVAINLCRSRSIRRLDEDYTIGPIMPEKNWTGRILGVSLHVLLLLLLAPIILILAGNEQISRSISKSPESASLIYEDISTFLRNTHMQISFVVTSSMDIAFECVRKDLDAVDDLLGKPYQQELAAETGIDMVLIELDELKVATAEVTSLVSDLIDDCTAAKTAGSQLQEQLNNIARQLTIARQQCTVKDRPLCFTLQYFGFETSLVVDKLTTDDKLRHLLLLATEVNFNTSIDAARKIFSQAPQQILTQAYSYVTDVKTVLGKKRSEVYKSTHALDVLTRSLSETITLRQEGSMEVIQEIVYWDLWRWWAVLGTTTMLSLIWGLLVCGAPCGCGLHSRTISLLLSGVVISCIMGIFIWLAASLSLLIAGHCRFVICDAFYDHPRYRTLGELMDAKGILHEDGLLQVLEVGNDTIRVADVLKNCQRNQPSYHTFHLYNTIDAEKITNYKKWKEYENISSNFMREEHSLEVLSPSLQLNLQGLSTATSLNLTTHRLQTSAPVTKRDLSSFADQLNTVARQLSDAPTARKIDNVAYNVRKAVQHELHALMQIQNAILFKLTTLEVLLPPLNRQANRTLLNLKGIQYFLDNQGADVGQRVWKRFTARIESTLEEFQGYVNEKVTKELGRCRPVWDLFHLGRYHFCKLIVDPTLGIAFFKFFALLLLATIAPVVLKLMDYYKEREELSSPSPHRGELITDEEHVWTTPISGSPPEVRLEQSESPDDLEGPSSSLWISPSPPRQPSPRRIPPPPRLPSLSSGVQSSRQLTQKAVTASRSPRRLRRNQESLKLVEPARWKPGSTTPRSWI